MAVARTLSRTLDHAGMANYALTGMASEPDESCARRLVEFGVRDIRYARELVADWRRRRGESA